MNKERVRYNLPEKWVWSTLGELGVVVSGGTPSTKEQVFWGGDISWITPADLSNFKEKYISIGKRNITKLGLDYSSAILLPKGSLLFSSRAPVGYVAISQNELATNQGFKSLIPMPSIYIDYLYYYLLSAKDIAINMSSGTTFLELSATNFSKIPVPLSPLTDQYQIVDKIEELFSEIDKAEDTILDIKQKLNICKESVLKRLLFREESTDQLFSIGDVVNRISTKVQPSSSSELKFIGLDSIEPNSSKISRVYEFKNYSSSGNYFEKGYILYARMRPYLNKVIKANYNGAASGEYIVLKCKDLILNDYLMYVLHSGTFVNYANQKSIGDRPRISFEDISKFKFYLGNLQEQKQIVNDIEYYFTIIEDLHLTIEKCDSQIVILRQSILQKAFEGKLINPAGEQEPATLLLEQIKREKIKYIKKQKEIVKNKPKKQKLMEEKKTIIEILQSADTPLTAENVWLQSEHKDNIEEFYTALKNIQNQIVATKKNAESFLSLKK